MPIGITRSPSLDVQPRLPVWIRWVNGEPRILAGGVPVVPFNTALRHRARHEGATGKSLAAYARAGALYATYCARQRVGLLDVANDEFPMFIDGLLGVKFRDASGNLVDLDGHIRSRASADHYLTLLYSLAGDVAHLYDVSFDWRRHRRIAGSGDGLTAVMRANLMTGLGQRVHRVRHTSRKVMGLPDQEFEKMLLRAVELWGEYLAPGDRRFALEPERQRGALLHRNVGILLCMRYAGARRSEVAPIRIDQVDRQGHHLELQTKGHRKGDVECLPVVLYSEVAAELWKYFTEYRPVVSNTTDQGYLFLSHGVRDYGRPISDSVIRDIFDQLRPALSPRWSKQATPHTLRHACAYQLQGRVSSDVIMAQMRHRSTRSLDPYRASALAFADQLLPTFSGSVQDLMPGWALARRRRPRSAGERRRGPAARHLQSQALEYFVPSRPTAELCGAAFARHVGLAYRAVRRNVATIGALKRAALRDKALAALQDLMSGARFIDQVSARHVSIAIGVRPELVQRLIPTELAAARASLTVRRGTTTFGRTGGQPAGDASQMQEPFFFEGGVVDLAANVWDFRLYPKVHRVLSKASIRPDLADAAWAVLRRTLRTGHEISTARHLWWGFVCAASVLDEFVDDLRGAELPAMQAAWYAAVKRDSHAKLTIARTALCRWFEEILSQPLEPVDAQRLARIVGWLREAPLPKRDDAGTALSTEAFAQLLRTCADAIAAGRQSEWPLDASSLDNTAQVAFNRWGIALMALVSGTTGLRRQSLQLIEVDDWGELQPGHFWLCWKHDKKREEHDAVLDPATAVLLDEYKQRTAAVRARLATRRLFLRIDLERRTWVEADAFWIWRGLRRLGDRARLGLPDGAVGLTTRLLRRTFATRQAQAGAHIQAIAAQLGHCSVVTTMHYVRYDRMTHVTDVRAALDAGAKLALVPWEQGPRLLADLPEDERTRFLGTRPEHDVGVGLCDQAGCVIVQQGNSIPPCFLCTHLLTGREFLPELDELRQATLVEIHSLPETPSFSALQANKRFELECLDRLIDGIRTRDALLDRVETG